MSKAGPTKREQLHPVIAQMREEGHTWAQISEKLGLSTWTLQEYLLDPDGSGVYRRKHQDSCRTCGKPINNGAVFCREHVGEGNRRRNRIWVLAKIREFQELNGRPPAVSDWRSSGGEGEVKARRWPAPSTVQSLFGSWNDALREAGVDGVLDVHSEAKQARVKRALELKAKGMTNVQIAAELSVDPKTISRYLNS